MFVGIINHMGNLIRAILWITGFYWFFTDKEAKPARKYLGFAIMGSWILFIILGIICILIAPNSGVDSSRVNGW
jgi:hypothetical protein